MFLCGETFESNPTLPGTFYHVQVLEYGVMLSPEYSSQVTDTFKYISSLSSSTVVSSTKSNVGVDLPLLKQLDANQPSDPAPTAHLQ